MNPQSHKDQAHKVQLHTESTQVKINKSSLFSAILFAFILVVGALTFWYAINVFLLAFASILFAVFLQTITSWIVTKTKLPYPLVLAGFVICSLAILVSIFWISAPTISHQINELTEQLPKAYQVVRGSVDPYIGKFLPKDNFTNALIYKNEKFFTQIVEVFSFTVGTIANTAFFLFVGLYLAYDPDQYIHGFLFLFPKTQKNEMKHVLSNIGSALRWWILGKVIAMTTIGILTFAGLRILNIPLSFILGLLAGLFAFIPYIGAILSAVPAILIALSISPLKAIYVVCIYLIIHAIESYLITPIVDQKTVFLPPALTVVVQIVLTLLVGFAGLALASPLTVLMLALLKEFVVKRHSLEQQQ